MPRLEVHLQEGFVREAVVLRLGDRTLADLPSVSTRLQIGLGEIVRADLPSGRHVLEVSLPARQKTLSIPFELHRELHIALNLEADGTLSHRVSESSFGYA